MPRILQLLLGPELIWCAVFLITSLTVRLLAPPGKATDDFFLNFYLYIPLVALLIFGIWFIPGLEKNWLLLRVWVAGIFGAHFAMTKGMSACSEQGPGVGTAYIIGMMLVFLALVAGSIFVKIRF